MYTSYHTKPGNWGTNHGRQVTCDDASDTSSSDDEQPPTVEKGIVKDNPHSMAEKWPGVFDKMTRSQLLEVASDLEPKSDSEKLNITDLRKLLIRHVAGSQNNPSTFSASNVESAVFQAQTLVKTENEMSRKGLVGLASSIDPTLEGQIKPKTTKPLIMEMINCAFRELETIKAKENAISSKEAIVAKERASGKAGSEKILNPTVQNCSNKQAWKKSLLDDLDEAQLLYVCQKTIGPSFSKNETAANMKEKLSEYLDQYRYEKTHQENDRIEYSVVQALGFLNVNDDLTIADMKNLAEFMNPDLLNALKGSKRTEIVKKCNAEFRKLSPNDVIAMQGRKEKLLTTRQQEKLLRQVAKNGDRAHARNPDPIARVPKTAAPNVKKDTATAKKVLATKKGDSTLLKFLVDVKELIKATEDRLQQE